MKESKEKEIILENIKPEILEILLKFIYLNDKVNLNEKNSIDVLYASAFYGIKTPT